MQLNCKVSDCHPTRIRACCSVKYKFNFYDGRRRVTYIKFYISGIRSPVSILNHAIRRIGGDSCTIATCYFEIDIGFVPPCMTTFVDSVLKCINSKFGADPTVAQLQVA